MNLFYESHNYETESISTYIAQWLPSDIRITADQLSDLLDIVGIHYYDDIKTLLLSEAIQIPSTQSLIEEIIGKTLGEHMINDNEFQRFLYLCSLLFEPFLQQDIESVCDKSSSIEQLISKALKSRLLVCDNDKLNYFFVEYFVRDYYRCQSLTNIDSKKQLAVFRYLVNKYPENYTDIAFLAYYLQLSREEIASYAIVAWYQENESLPQRRLNNLKGILNSSYIGSNYLYLVEAVAKDASKSDEALLANKSRAFLEIIKNSNISCEAKCCCLQVVSSILYAYGMNKEIMLTILDNYFSAFNELKVFSASRGHYLEYIADALMLSADTSLPNVYRYKLDRLSSLIEPNNSISDFKRFRLYRLGQVVLNSSNCDYTQLAYVESSNYPYQHVLSAINYSATLICSGKSSVASQILKEESASNHDKLLGPITYFSFTNNRIIADYHAGAIRAPRVFREYKQLVKKLETHSFDDKKIILNNYAASMLLKDTFFNQDPTEILLRLAEDPDPYHKFFAQHNLLVFYCLTNNSEAFHAISGLLEPPYLLHHFKRLFAEKIEVMANNFSKCTDLDAINSVTSELYFRFHTPREKYYLSPILWGVLERWFE